MNITGKIHAIMQTQQVTATFRKREFVLEFAENPEYPQFILYQLVQDRVELIDQYKVGDTVDVSFNLRGRSWTSPQGETKYFNSLEAWRINPVGDQQGAIQGATQQNRQPVAAPVAAAQQEDDLPF